MRQSWKYWGLVATSLLCWGRALAQAQGAETVSLQTLGYSRSILLQGSSPEFNLGIPAPSGGIDPSASFVQLRLDPSPVLDPESTVRVLINQEPMGVFSIGQLRANPIVQVPIPDLPSAERFINLSVQPFLSISGDICQDISTGNLFLTVGRDSFFQVVPRLAESTVADFFRPLYSQLSLVVPADLSPETTEAALWLYSLLAHQFPQTPILWTSGSVSGPQVVLESPEFAPQLQRQGSTLRVAASSEAIRALYSQWKRPGLISKVVGVEAAPAIDPPTQRNRRSLRELGFANLTLRGIGSQSLLLNFDLAQLGGRPRDLVLQIDAVMTPVDGRLGDRLNGQVFLNGVLLQTYNLTGRNQLNESIRLPSGLLRRANTLELRFDYAPSQGNCRGALIPLTLQVRGDSSALSWSGYEAAGGELQEIPALLQGTGQLLLPLEDLDLIASAAYLLGSLSRLSPMPLLPTVAPLPELLTSSSLPNGDPGWRLIVGGPEQVNLDTPIRLGSQFEILNPLNQQVMLAVQPEDELGLLQYFLQGGKPTLWLSWWGSDPTLAERLSRSLADPRTLLASQIQGNVVTAYAAAPNLTQVQSWDLSGQTYQVRYPDRLDWRLRLWRYRFLLVIVVALLGAGAAWSLYRRLARLPEVPTPPPQG